MYRAVAETRGSLDFNNGRKKLGKKNLPGEINVCKIVYYV